MDANINESNKKEQFNGKIVCDICQDVDGVYECQECPNFKILCPKCDVFIHSMQNKSTHIRQKIKGNKNPNSINEFFNNIENIDKNNYLKKETSPITNNYLEQIKGIYEHDKQIILDENNSLQQKINTNKSLYKHKINNLESKLNELQTKSDNNLRMMKDNHNMDLKKIITEKDFEINYLINNNKELEKINNDLKNKLNENMGEFTKDQSNYKDMLTTLEFSFNKLQKENIDIKDYYENKINFLIENFNMEKKKLINGYELDIEELNNEYNKSKDKYINYLGKRENDIENNEKENQKEINILKEKVKNLSEKVNELKNRREELIKMNNELKFDNNVLSENFERISKELQYETKRKELEKQKVNESQKYYQEVMKENQRISKIARNRRSKSVKY